MVTPVPPCLGRPLAAGDETLIANRAIEKAERLHEAVASRDGQQHNEPESAHRTGLQDRPEPPAGYATQSPHAQPDGAVSEGEYETEHECLLFFIF